jgi:hypothetical protein
MEATRIATSREAWNKGKLVGQKAPCKLQEIWAIRIQLLMQGRVRELVLFDLEIDNKSRACDLVNLCVRDVCHSDRVVGRDSASAKDPASGPVRDRAADP